MAAIHDHKLVDYHFYSAGFRYYAAGRFAFLNSLSPVDANLLHHGVEMMLKGRLTHVLTLKEMAKHPYRHCLPAIWQTFRSLFPDDDLSRFDGVIEQLDEFE